MKPSDLDLLPTQMLIDELLRRATFQGVIVHTRHEAKTRHWSGSRDFSVRHSASLDTEEVGRLLNVVGQHIVQFETE